MSQAQHTNSEESSFRRAVANELRFEAQALLNPDNKAEDTPEHKLTGDALLLFARQIERREHFEDPMRYALQLFVEYHTKHGAPIALTNAMLAAEEVLNE